MGWGGESWGIRQDRYLSEVAFYHVFESLHLYISELFLFLFGQKPYKVSGHAWSSNGENDDT